MSTPKDVAQWMQTEIERRIEFFHIDAIDEIHQEFGGEFIDMNEKGGFAISKAVLKEFRELTKETVVWERGLQYWRLRDSHDTSGKTKDSTTHTP
jgi:hypothetical protein